MQRTARSSRAAKVPAFWLAGIRQVGRVLADAVFPCRCAACRQYWSAGSRQAPGSAARRAEIRERSGACFMEGDRPFLCPDCLAAFEPVAAPLCLRCGVMFVSRIGESHLCGDCMRARPHFRQARAAGVYSGALMALVHQVKYRACLALVDPLARLLQEAFQRHWHPADIDLVLPIPLHGGRLRKRGFNQAQLLVDAWARADRSGGPCGMRFPKVRHILRRRRATRPQTGLGKAERRRNMRGAFSVVDERAVAERRILLVDDVYTTGATVNEAARVLKRYGAQAVDVLTVARTMPYTGRRGDFPNTLAR